MADDHPAPLTDLDPAARHARVAGRFHERTTGVGDWDAPAPVPGWTARDVVRHLVDWFPPFLEGGTGISLPATTSVDDDPSTAWQEQMVAVQRLLDDPATGDRVLSNPHIGEVPLPEAVDRFYTTDVFLHTWDLARATGQDESLDPVFCEALLAGMRPMDEVLRMSGQYGPRVDVPPGSSVQAQLLGFIGRRP